MSRGKRYDNEPKLNLKKVFAVGLAIIVIIMSIVMLSGMLGKDNEKTKITSQKYVAVFHDNKWGVIDTEGKEIIAPSYEEMITIPNKQKDVFLCVYDVNYETGEYKTKALNSKDEEIFTQYDQIEAISNQDKNGNVMYETKILKVKKGEKYGIINTEGKQIVPCEYEEIAVIPGIENAVKLRKDNKYGIIDSEGNKILPVEYSDITNLGKDSKSGFIVKNESGKYGIVNYSNDVVLNLNYDEITKIYGNDMYVVKQDGRQVMVDKTGAEILKEGYDEIKQILKNKENGVIYTISGKSGIMKLTGEKIIEPEYDELIETKTGLFIAKKDEKYGIIDLQNQIKVEFKYTSISYNEKSDIYIAENADFTEDIIDNTFTVRQTGILLEINDQKGYFLLKQGEDEKYYNFKFEEKQATEILTTNTLFKSKKNGKYGFVDKDGKVIVEYIYDDATSQNSDGYAGIKKDGKWGSIDAKGNVVQEPTYNLDDYLEIDFIGRWHLGKDLNMNYYNQL